jgi:hypothetical protein
MVSLDQRDPTFVDDLMKSPEAVAVAARWLAEEWGLKVEVPEIKCRPDVSQFSEYSDDGDLFIHQKIEVKRRSLKFSSLETYPYPTAIVDNCHAWDRARPKPYAYFLFNHDLTGFLLCKTSTRPHWKKHTGYQEKRGRVRSVYLCPVELCEYRSIDKNLLTRCLTSKERGE